MATDRFAIAAADFFVGTGTAVVARGIVSPVTDRAEASPMRTPLPRLVVRRLEAGGHDARMLCGRFDLPWEAMGEPTVVAPLDALEQFYDAAASELREPDLGLRLVADVPRGAYGLFEFGVRASSTLRDALDRLCRTMVLFNRIAHLEWTSGPRCARVEMAVPGRAGGLGRHANEFFIALLVASARGLLERHFAVTRVWFSHGAPPSCAAVHRAFAGAAIEFGASTNGFEFDAAWLDEPLLEADVALRHAIDAHARALVVATEPALVFELRRTLRALDRLDDAALRPVARRLGHSARSLQRHLQQLSTTFRDVVDEVRAERLRSLEAEGVGIDAIATRLGYRDVTALRRAQRRWRRATPPRRC
jgi:AraC-like DNA-binding protein